MTPRTTFRPDVEGLRGLAVLLVVAYHVGIPHLGGGYVGVDVFFVLSGFIITRLIVAELASTGRFRYAHFYARRVRRLLPAAATVIVATLVAASVLYPPRAVLNAATAARFAAALFSNGYFAGLAGSYFLSQTAAARSPLLHMWSLSVEEQFYLVWPMLVVLAAGRRAPSDRLAATFAAIVAGSLALSWYWTIARQTTAFYGTPMRGWEFAVGGAVTLLPASWSERIGRAPRARAAGAAAAAATGLAMIVAAAVAFSDRTPFPGLDALLPVMGTALVLAAGTIAPAGVLSSTLGIAPMQWIGRHSYGWYLWHWPALVLGTEALPGAMGLPIRVVLAAAALLLAWGTRIAIEDPVRYGVAWRGRPRLVVAVGATGLASIWTGATAVAADAGRAMDTPAYRAISAATSDHPRLYDHGCAAEFSDTTVRVCETGAPTRPVATIAVFGDSHAAQWVPALESVALQRRWRVLILTKRACPSAEITVFEPVLRRAYDECDAWRRAALDSIRSRRPSVVLISNTMDYVIGGPWPTARASVSAEEYERGLDRTLAALHAAGLPAVVLQDVPRPPESVPECLERALWRGHDPHECDLAAREDAHVLAEAATRRAVAHFANDHLIDLNGALCPGGVCPAIRDGAVLYRDNEHISTREAVKLAPALAASLAASGAFRGAGGEGGGR